MATLWLVEDHPAFRKATERALSSLPSVTSVRAFLRCEDVLKALPLDAPPEVILMDVGLPGMDGITGIREIKSIAPNVSILVLTVFEEDDKIFRAVCAGACGYLLKSSPMADVMEGVRQALLGGAPMNPRIARRMLEMFSKMAPEKRDYGLSDREQAVLECMVDGLAKKQMADRLELNQHTLDYVVRCLYKKLHVNCQSAAVSVAMKDGLVER